METKNSVTCTHTAPVKIALYIGIGIALFLGGAAAYPSIEQYVTPTGEVEVVSSVAATRSSGYDEGFAAARKLVEESSFGSMFKTPDDIRVLTGTVTEANEGSFTLHLQSGNPFDDAALADRVILITASTSIMRNTQKDLAVFKTEVADFLKKAQGTTTRVLPMEFTAVPVKASDIKVGDTVSVTALFGIKLVKEFNAHLIQILPNTSSL